MAMTKKAAAEALRNMDLTKAKDDDGGKLRVEGTTIEQLGREYAEAHAQIEELEMAQKERKAQIIEKVAAQRLKAEKQGRFYATAQVDLGDDELLQVLWTDRYKTLDVQHQALLQKAFGKHYDELFFETAEAKTKDEWKLEDLQIALGTRAYDTLMKFMKVQPALKLRKGFMETRAHLRNSFDQTTNDSIDTVVANAAYSPTLKVVRPK